MAVKSRVPGDLTDDKAVRPFLDSIDRKLIKIGQLNDLAASPTATEIATLVNSILAIMRER